MKKDEIDEEKLMRKFKPQKELEDKPKEKENVEGIKKFTLSPGILDLINQ